MVTLLCVRDADACTLHFRYQMRVRSLPFVRQFVVYSLLSARQARHTAGFLGGKLVGNANRAFWTIPAWENDRLCASGFLG